jgi:hypothetical protein
VDCVFGADYLLLMFLQVRLIDSLFGIDDMTLICLMNITERAEVIAADENRIRVAIYVA